MGRPWLVGQIADELNGRRAREPASARKAALAIEHYQGLLSLYGRSVGLRHARKHLAAYAEDARRFGLTLPPQDRLRLVASEDPDEVLRLLRSLFEERQDATPAAEAA